MKGLAIIESMYQDLESARTMLYQKASRIISNPDAYDGPKVELDDLIHQIADIEKRQSLIMFFIEQYEKQISSSQNDKKNDDLNDKESSEESGDKEQKNNDQE